MRRLISQFFYSVLLISCMQEKDGKANTLKSSEDSVLMQFLTEYYHDMSERDWKKYRQYFWDKATITTAWQRPGDSAARVHVITIDEFIKETPNGPDSQPVFKEQMKNANIHVSNKLADAWVEYDAEFGKPDSLMKWSGTDVFTFIKHNDEWKIASLVFESN